MRTLNRFAILAVLESNGNKIFSMKYNKSNGEIRKATCLLHVTKPKHTLVPGTGKYIGESAKDALYNHGNLKYFDLTVDGKPRDGQTQGKGDFRCAKIANIVEITIAGETYLIKD